MSNSPQKVAFFPLNRKCAVRFKGEREYYKGTFKEMVTKNRVIFFGDIENTSRVAKLPGSGGMGEVAEIRVL